MAERFFGVESLGAYSTVSAVEPNPTTSPSDGIQGRDGAPEVYWYFSAVAANATCTVQWWFFDSVAGRWVKNGDVIAITGNEVIQSYQPGATGRHHAQIALMANGPYTRNIQYVDKEA